MSTSKIEWTDASWNPITGCTKISSGCQHCYAEVMARRLCAMRVDKYKNGFQVTLHEDCLEEPVEEAKDNFCMLNERFIPQGRAF